MENKVKRQLYLLDGMIKECQECPLYRNGHIKPYWTEHSRYVIMSEQLTGKADSLLWELMGENGFKKEQFLIINKINCLSDDTTNPSHVEKCQKWLDMYINIIMPLRGIMFGKYLHENSTLFLMRVNNLYTPIIPIVKSVTPKFATYNDEGKKLLEQSILKFKLM